MLATCPMFATTLHPNEVADNSCSTRKVHLSQLKSAVEAVNGARAAANADPDGQRLDDFIASAT